MWNSAHCNVDTRTSIWMPCIESIRALSPHQNKSAASDRAVWPSMKGHPAKFILSLIWSAVCLRNDKSWIPNYGVLIAKEAKSVSHATVPDRNLQDSARNLNLLLLWPWPLVSSLVVHRVWLVESLVLSKTLCFMYIGGT